MQGNIPTNSMRIHGTHVHMRVTRVYVHAYVWIRLAAATTNIRNFVILNRRLRAH